MVQQLGKRVWQFLVKHIKHLLYDPATLQLDIFSRKLKLYVHKMLYLSAYRNCVSNNPDLEVTLLPMKWLKKVNEF